MDKMEKEGEQGYERVHFFKYFLSEEDWNARHDYHVQKRRLHLCNMHGMGIQDGDQSLLVRAQAEPCLKVDVTPGIGTDGQGREIYVPAVDSVAIEPDKFQLPVTLYVKVVYQEMASDRVRLGDGRIENRFFRETYRFIVSDRPADDNQLELCRIAVTTDCTAIRDPIDPTMPGPNEIDMRNRRLMPCTRAIDMEAQHTILRLLRDRKAAFDRLGGHTKLPELALLGQNFAIMQELIESNVLKESALGGILRFFQALDTHVIESVTASINPETLDRPEWKRHVDNCRAFRILLDEPGKTPMQILQMALVQLEKLSISYAHVVRLLGNERRIYIPGQVKPLPRTYPITSSWDFVKVWSAEMPQIFKIDDLEWFLIGELNITDEASERKYKFRICESRDIWKNRQRLYFPDGALIDDTGVAHEGGYSEFEIPGIIPDTHLCVIRMMDYARGDYELLINANGQDVGISRCDGYDRRTRWRNWPFVIPSAFVNDTVLRVRQTCLTADRDINMFRYWFYQPLDW
ncbi:MAG: hypothetical protein IJM59_03565 [Proteobacteria bacterium]|nr:hypothetical protein [Pseudomonadota bacterium]